MKYIYMKNNQVFEKKNGIQIKNSIMSMLSLNPTELMLIIQVFALVCDS